LIFVRETEVQVLTKIKDQSTTTIKGQARLTFEHEVANLGEYWGAGVTPGKFRIGTSLSPKRSGHPVPWPLTCLRARAFT